MKRKHFILALVAMLWSFSLSAQQLLVNCDYNSSTEGYGTTKFSNYAGAYAYATANGKTSTTIVIEKTNTLSGNTFDNNHKNYSRLAVLIKDGATMGNAASKWDMTYPVTVEPGGTLTCARPASASVSNIHIKNKLIVGAKGATKKAYVNFLSDSYQDCDISIRYNGSIEVYNADFYVQDLDAQGKLTIEDSNVEVDGAFASATSSWYPTTLTNSTITINGNQISGGLSDFSGGTSNQLGNVKINNSTLTIKEGDTKVAANVTATNSTIDVNNLIVNSGKTLNLNEGSTLDAENITTAGTGSVKIDGVQAEISGGQAFIPVAKIGEQGYATLAAAVEAAQAGAEIVVVANVADVTVDVTKNLTISGSVTLNNVGVNANGADALTVKGLTFTGNSWINSGTAEALTVSGVTATVAPSNTAYTNSRSAFISLGRSEQQTLALTVENCNITVTSSGPDAILGWAAITKATITGNVIKGSSNGYFTNADAIKFMAIADGAEFEIKNNEIYSNYNGIVFGQNTTRANAYSVYADANKFVGGADHIWIEVSGANTVHATVNATSANTVNGNAFTIDDIKYHSGVIKTWSSYAGVDVVTDENGKVIGGTLASYSNKECITEGYEMNTDGTVGKKVVAKVNGVEYATLSAAFAAVTDDNQTVVICKDVTENLTATLRGNITTENETEVTITLTNSDWVNCPYTFVLGENITLNVPALFYYAGGSQINGTVVAGAYYQRYAGTKLTINEPGSMTVTGETCIIRYMDGDPNAGIYVVGDNNDETIGLNLAVAYFYQGMINAKNANIKAGTYWQTNETDGQGSANLVLDNSTLKVTVNEHNAKATGNSTVTLTNGSKIIAAGGFEYGANTELSVDAESSITDKNGIVKLPVAKIDNVKYTTLQAAINAVKNGETITFLSDITENVTLTEKTGLYYTIDGNGKEMNGTITISSLSDTNDNRRITIKGINFVTNEGRDFITSTATNHYPRLTVEGCSFTGTNKEAADCVAIRLKSSHSVVIKDCTGTGLHSFLQNTAGWNLTIENVTVTDSKSGLALGTVQGVTVEGCDITADGYGIRLDAGYNNNAVIESNKVESFIPVVVRKATVDSNITVQGTNTFTATNTDGLWMAIGTSEYEANGEMPAAATAKVKVVVNSNLPQEGLYGNHKEGSLSAAYTATDGYWGECGGNANYTFELKFFSGETFMGSTSLNDVDNIINGNVNVTWNIKLDAASNTDNYWTMSWTVAPTVAMQPNRVEQWVDGVKVAECAIQLNGPDNLNPIVAAAADADGVIKSFATSFDAAVATAQAGNEVVILKAGTYALKVKNNITITGAVDGVEFANIGAFGCGGANVTFNNVTFTYAANSSYKGLQHSGNLVYNNCTFNGQVFLYGQSETFNNCAFVNTGDNYNVWTYGAKEVAFNECTFNSAGKSVLIYAESASVTNDVTVTKCTFNASQAVEGKAAIEMDSSLTGGINLTIDGETTATGFGTGNVSGNSLWNNKKGNSTDANNDITVKVGNETVLAPVTFVAKIGNNGYTTIADAIKAAQTSETVTILAGNYTTNIDVNKAVTVQGATDAEGNNLVNITGNVSVNTGATVKNLNVHNDATGDYACALDVNGKDIVLDGVNLSGYNAMRYCYATGNITIKNSTLTSRNFTVHFDGKAGGNVSFENCDITGWCSYASTIGTVSYANSTIAQGSFAGHRYFNKNISFTECDFAEGFKVELKASGTTVAFTDTDMTMADAEVLFKDPYYVANGNITVNGTKVAYEASGYVNGASTYGKLQDIINGISSGNYITLRSDNVHTEPIVIPAGKKVEIGGLDKFKLEGTITLEAGAILDLDSSTVPEGLTVTTDVAGNKVVYDGNTYKVESYAVKVTYPAGNPVYAEGKVEYYDDMLEAVPYTTNCPRLEGATITLLKDVAAAGLRFMENDMVFDLNGHTYTITAGTGSQGTNTSGFQIRPEVTTNVIFKNGTINVAEGAPVCWMFNCYATQFIVENVTVDCANMAWSYGSSCLVVVSRAEDDVQLLGTTEIKNFNAEVAGDAYSVGGTMTVAESAIVPGTFKLGGGAVLTAPAGLEVKPADGYKVVYADGVYTSVATRAEVATKAELNAALANADIETIVMTADIDYGTDQLAITKAITLDLGGKTLTTRNAWGGMSIKGNPTVKNGNIVHASNTAAIKVWNATAFEDLVIDVQGKGDANKTIGGIVLQSGSTTKVGSIKNVTIKGAALTNGIETYNCGDATENVIGAMENVTITAQGTGMLISAPCGTATNCSISGGVAGIELWIKGNYSATLGLENCQVEGGEKPVYIHDEFSSNPNIQNNGTLKLSADEATNFTSESGALAAVNIARAENVECEVVDALIENAIVCVDDVYFDDFAKAWAAVKAGQTVTLLADLEASEVIMIGKSMTINGDDHKVTSSASRVFRLTASNIEVTLNDVNMVDTKASSYTADIRGISIDAGLQNVKLTLNNSSVDFTDASACDWAYAVNVSGNGTGHTVTVNGGSYEGANVINAHGANNTIVVENATLTSLYPNNDVYYGACVWVLENQGSSVTATGNTFNGSNAMVFNVGTGTTVTESNNTDNTTMCVAKIGNEYYTSLADAFAAGGEVKVLHDITLAETVTVPADKTITLDLNGKTISQEKACTGNYNMILNKGNLTITGEGKISFKDTGAGDPNYGWGSYTVRNEGTLVVENGTIEHLGEQAAHMYCAIFQYSGKSTINGGTISTPNYRSARLWKGEMTVNGGNFEGQLWVQAVDNTSNLEINGGTFAPRGNDGSSVFVTNSTYDVAFAVTDGTFNGKIGCSDATKLAGAITGGTFSATAKENTAAALIATGYVFGEADANGYYTIVDDPDTHYINNVEEFVAFRDAVNAGNDFAGVAVYLTADIDLTGIDWSVNIGDDCSATFDGTFDGQGHTIKNLTSTETAQKGDGYICTGLFGAIHGGAVLKNFTVENVAINTGDFTGNNVAAVVGFAYQATGSIENVKVTGDININAAKAVGVGAIIGYDYYSPALEVKNCVVSGNGGSAIVGKSYVGGAVGYASSKIALNNNTVENVSVTATGSVGALAGIMLSGSSATDNTVKNVALTATGELWANSAAVVAGTITSGGVTVANTTVENVTANGVAAALVGGQLVEKPTAPIAKVEAKIGDKYYTTLDAALATQGEATVELLVPVTVAAGESRVIELNGKTITATDNATGSYAMITNKGNLTINGEGAIKLTATINRGWNAYSSVISNTVGGKLTVNGGTIEHLGGTDMAYAIDNLTNGKGTYAETVINGGTVKSTYRAVRQFLNGVEAQNILTVNGGTIEGANKSIWMQDPSKNANTGTLTVAADAVLKGDVYLFVTAGSTEWPVEVAIANAAFATGTVVTGNVPAQYAVANVNGVWSNVSAVAAIDGVGYATLAAAVAAAKAGDTITLLQDVEESVTISKNLTIDGAGKTITGMITTDGKSLRVTIKNVNFVGNNGEHFYAVKSADAYLLTIESCTAKNYKYGFLYANSNNYNIAVKNVTVENCTDYGAYTISVSGSATFENFTVKGSRYGVLVANKGTRNVYFNNVTFEGAETPIYINENGTGNVTFHINGVNEMGKEEFYTSEYVKFASAIQVGTKVRGNFAEAFAAAQDGETIKLLSDFNLASADVVKTNDGKNRDVCAVVNAKNVTFDMNGKKVSLDHQSTTDRIWAVVFVADGAELTVTGNGTIDVNVDDNTPRVVYMFLKNGSTGYLVIENGNFHMDNSEDSMVFSSNSNTITVKGGTFILDEVASKSNGWPVFFGVKGTNTGYVNVLGGTYNYDITQQKNGEVKIGSGYTIRDNGDDTWSVVTGVSIIDGQLTEYANDKTQVVEYISYKRKIAGGIWNPLYVPFEIPVEVLQELGYEVAIFYDVHFEITDGGVIDPNSTPDLHIVKIKEGTLKANYPYLIRATKDADLNLSLELENETLYSTAAKESVEAGSTTTRFIFAGTYTKATPEELTGRADVPCYVLTSRGTFGKMATDARLSPFRVFMYVLAKNGSPVILNDVAAEAIRIRVIGESDSDTTEIKYYESDEVKSVDYIFDLQGRRVLEPQKGNLYIINGKKVIF